MIASLTAYYRVRRERSYNYSIGEERAQLQPKNKTSTPQWSQEPFLQNRSNTGAKIAYIAISQYIKKQFTPSV